MKISRLASWVGPAYVGSIASAWAAVTGYVVFAKPAPLLGSQWLTWLLLVAFATPIASALATTMLVLDVMLLKFKVRALPTGGSAWRMALLAPVPVAAALWFLWPSLGNNITHLAVSLTAPVFGSALAVRLALGERIQTS